MMIADTSIVTVNIITTITAIGVIRGIVAIVAILMMGAPTAVIRMMDNLIVATLTVRDTVVIRDTATKISTERVLRDWRNGVRIAILLDGLIFMLRLTTYDTGNMDHAFSFHSGWFRAVFLS
jgi:hypothetical protein